MCVMIPLSEEQLDLLRLLARTPEGISAKTKLCGGKAHELFYSLKDDRLCEYVQNDYSFTFLINDRGRALLSHLEKEEEEARQEAVQKNKEKRTERLYALFLTLLSVFLTVMLTEYNEFTVSYAQLIGKVIVHGFASLADFFG